MTTEQLRKEIKVVSYGIFDTGIYIGYTCKGGTKHIALDPEESARQLSAIGSIDSYRTDIVFSINMDGLDFNWTTFLINFKLSQWEALTLAIRYEAEKELENDANLLEMDKAIEALKNS